MLWAGSCDASTSLLREPPVSPPSPCPGMPSERPGCGSGGEGRIPFCRCRVIYDMRESHCLDSSCIFPRALPLFPDPRCAAATVRLLWGCSPCRGYAGQSRGGLPAGPDPSVPRARCRSPAARRAEGLGMGLWAHPSSRPPEAFSCRRGGGGQRDLGRLAPFSLPFQRRQCPRCIQIPRPFLLLTSAHINKLPHRASVEQSVP